MMETVNAVLPSRNLNVNEDKTEYTFLQCRDRNTKIMEERQESRFSARRF